MQSLKFDKKVLVVSNWAPPTPGGSPHVFYNLMSNFDPASYVFYTHEKNFRTTDLRRKLPCTHYTYASARRGGGIAKITFPVKQAVALVRTVSDGLRIIKKENIGLLLGMPDRGTALFLILILSVLSRRPYALYMLDPYRGNDFPPMRRLFARIFEPVFLRAASLVIVTGSGHMDMLRHRYGGRIRYATLYHSSHGPASLPVRKFTPHGPPYTILYTGTVYGAQDRSIRNLIRAIEAMPELNISLQLYVPKRLEHVSRAFAGIPSTSIHTGKPEEMAAIQQGADILFLPLSWSLSESVLGMAIPGKTPEYLVAGKPILVHAPPASHLVEYARKEGFAEIVEKEDTEALKAAVRRLLTDAQYVERLLQQARKAFENNHRAEKNAAKFKEMLDRI